MKVGPALCSSVVAMLYLAGHCLWVHCAAVRCWTWIKAPHPLATWFGTQLLVSLSKLGPHWSKRGFWTWKTASKMWCQCWKLFLNDSSINFSNSGGIAGLRVWLKRGGCFDGNLSYWAVCMRGYLQWNHSGKFEATPDIRYKAVGLPVYCVIICWSSFEKS